MLALIGDKLTGDFHSAPRRRFCQSQITARGPIESKVAVEIAGAIEVVGSRLARGEDHEEFVWLEGDRREGAIGLITVCDLKAGGQEEAQPDMVCYDEKFYEISAKSDWLQGKFFAYAAIKRGQ